MADPSGGPVLSHFSTVLPCPAAPSGALSGLYLPSFSTNLVAASGQVFAAASRSGPESAPCSCRLLSHETLLWHHRLGHPSLPRLRDMASRVLVSGLPRSLPPLPSGPGPSCVPCVEGRLRAAPHSSQFPPTEAPLQTLHMDVWGPACVRGQGHERYFLLVVDDYSRFTTVFPLRSKGDVTEVLIDWIRAARLQLRRSFGSDFPVLRLHSDRGGEFSSGLLRAYCRAQGIRQTFTLPDSPQQNGIAERRIGHDQPSPRGFHAGEGPRTSPALLWTGKVGYASAFRSGDLEAFGGICYHPPLIVFCPPRTSRFDESVPSSFYRLFPYRTTSLPPATGRPCAQWTLGPAADADLGVLTLGVLCAWVLRLELLSVGVLGLGVLRLELLSLGGAESGGAMPGAAGALGCCVWRLLSLAVRSLRLLDLPLWRLAVLA
ncbi:unnamed protein product [Closterium sp. NIES-64]|nr:unnamed protein product [Closterium sp. NIES-64]